MRILVVDNYDSFVFNLVQYLGQLGTTADVWRNDDDRLTAPGALAGVARRLRRCAAEPGTGHPRACRRRASTSSRRAPTRALRCSAYASGHQSIGVAFGATVDRAPELLHGKTSVVHHNDTGVLAGLPSPFTATRYHSLTVLPENHARRARGDRSHRERRHHGDAPPRAADPRRAVPPRVRAHPGRSPDARELARQCAARRRRRRSSRSSRPKWLARSTVALPDPARLTTKVPDIMSGTFVVRRERSADTENSDADRDRLGLGNLRARRLRLGDHGAHQVRGRAWLHGSARDPTRSRSTRRSAAPTVPPTPSGW